MRFVIECKLDLGSDLKIENVWVEFFVEIFVIKSKVFGCCLEVEVGYFEIFNLFIKF